MSKHATWVALRVVLVASAWLPNLRGQQARAAAEVAPANITQLEDAVLAQRRRIRSGHFRVKQTFVSFASGRRNEAEMVTWLDGSRVREDQESGGVVRTKCFGEKLYYGYEHREGYGLEVRDFRFASRKDHHYFVHDPTILMLYPLWYRVSESVHKESFIGSPRRTKFALQRTQWDGQEAWQVSFMQNDCRITYWVVPSRGYSIVRMASYAPTPQTVIEHSVQSTNAHVRDGIWFPTTVRYVELVDGKLTEQEDLEIETISINEPIDSAIFTPSGMNIPPGTVASRFPRTSDDKLMWDGKQVVRISDEEFFAKAAAWDAKKAGGDQLRRFTFLALSVMLAGIGAMSLWRRHVKQGASASA